MEEEGNLNPDPIPNINNTTTINKDTLLNNTLKLEINISPAVGPTTPTQSNTHLWVRPINLTLEYPQDVNVSVSAVLLKGLSSSTTPPHQHLLNKTSYKTLSWNTEKDEVVEGVAVLNNGKAKEPSSHPPQEKEFFDKNNNNDESLYQSVLLGNDSLFGDISMIGRGGSEEEDAQPLTTPPHPILLSEEEEGEDVTRSPYNSSTQQTMKLDGSFSHLTSDYKELQKLVDEMLETIESGEKEGGGGDRGSGQTINLTNNIPMKEEKFLISQPLTLKGVKETLSSSKGQGDIFGGMSKFKWQSQRKCEGEEGPHHACHICIPLPDHLIRLLYYSLGLEANEARKAAFTLINYLREERESVEVKPLIKYICGGNEITKKRSKRRIIQPTPHTKDEKVKSAIRSVARQKGAWGIFEDEQVVISHLNLLNTYLATFDTKWIGKALREDRYESVKALTIYFALEKRATLRSLLTTTFNLLVGKDSTSHAFLISSDLPVDLANAIKVEYIENEGGEEMIFKYVSCLLALMTSGRHLQVDHLERMDCDFVYCLLQISENGLKDGCSEELRDLAIQLVLAYNLQFTPDEGYRNKVMGAICALKEADYLKQKIHLILLNKDGLEDEDKVGGCEMVIKLAMDILMSNRTSHFFLDSDLNIMLASLSSYLTELQPGDQRRKGGLRLARIILRRLDYNHNGLSRFLQCLKGILMEKGEEGSKEAHKIARKIAKEIEATRRSNNTLL